MVTKYSIAMATDNSARGIPPAGPWERTASKSFFLGDQSPYQNAANTSINTHTKSKIYRKMGNFRGEKYSQM